VEERADEISRTLLSRIPDIRDALATDVQAAFDGDPAAEDLDEIIFSYPGIFAMSVYRVAHELYLLSVPLIPRIMTEYAHGRTGIDIHAGATIGRYFFIDHGTSVVIGSNAFITKSVPERTKVSVKNSELVFKGEAPREFEQEFIPDWVI
jgi:serine O-acetyltransferase